MHSEEQLMEWAARERVSLNPLESGHAFRGAPGGPGTGKGRIGLNPLESGHAFRERGAHYAHCWAARLNPLESGHAFRVIILTRWPLTDTSLNPLESGHAFRERGSGGQE